MNYSHVYSGNPVDRGEKERRDDQWLADMAKDPSSKFLPLNDLNVLVPEGDSDALGWIGAGDLERLGVTAAPMYLGMLDGTTHFVVDVSGQEKAVAELSEGHGFRFIDARSVTDIISAQDSGIVAQARAQINWHNVNGFCAICGGETFVKRGGQVRQCSKCNKENYPRTDPVVITVVSDGDSCLLGQSRRGRLARTNTYSALAGFVDQGESVEEAVAREVMEEAGIQVGEVRYHSSQPWPFPSSLMIGCHADAATTEINFDDDEMNDVRWFSRDEVVKALEGKSEILAVPQPIAIAHHLIRAWVNGNG
ncbi:MAG: NAD(+) diphosphatase [SAR202 cluster bacterium]|nr:NAD(+) diphosphatase [Chloroflexota bacterium]MQG34241.1 NAD(+) diphosphatase [SAR202 cluster bacterium]HCP24846.1 NAD(+) diphosphatase [Dehalococcoidia bacterium]